MKQNASQGEGGLVISEYTLSQVVNSFTNQEKWCIIPLATLKIKINTIVSVFVIASASLLINLAARNPPPSQIPAISCIHIDVHQANQAYPTSAEL